ncbi:MAG: type II secretion system protein, partial [Verrucomicrobiota bacterium]
MKTPTTLKSKRREQGFTLIEVALAIGIMGMIAILLASMLGTAGNSWIRGEEVVETYQAGSTAMELMTREVAGATIDTCAQFTVMKNAYLQECGAACNAPDSQAVMFVAPIGREGEVRRLGYYLHRDDDRKFYRLKRLYVGPENEDYYD